MRKLAGSGAGLLLLGAPGAALARGADAAQEGARTAVTENIFGGVRDLIVARTGEGGWMTAVQVFTVVFFALLLDFVQRGILKRVARRLEKTRTPWDDALIQSLARPISLLIWVVGLAQALAFIDIDSLYIHNVVVLALIVSVTLFLLRFTREAEKNLVAYSADSPEEERWDPTTVDAIGKLARLSVGVTAVLIGLQQIGVNISAVLAFGGIGGIAVGFAAKDLLANFFGGLTIYLDQPFRVGEWIRSPDRTIEGTVEYIGWRLTRIRTFDQRPLYVPNSVFTTIAIENPQRMLNRRIYETIGIRYDDIAQMDAITSEVRSMLESHPDIDTNRTLMVNFNAFGPSSVDFFVYTFTKTTKWTEYHEIKHRILLRISAIITNHGAEIAYPTSTLHVASLPEQAEAAAG
ncbi:MAG: mechanosensitive ion channel family protein [Acidobacteriota bacterium]|jgi:MscS family membrane protein